MRPTKLLVQLHGVPVQFRYTALFVKPIAIVWEAAKGLDSPAKERYNPK